MSESFGAQVVLVPGTSISLENLTAPTDLTLVAVRLGTGDAGFALCGFSTRTIRTFNPVVEPVRNISAAGEPLLTWGYYFDLDARVGFTHAFDKVLFGNPSRTSPPITVEKERRFVCALFQTAAWNPATQQFDAAIPMPLRYLVTGTVDFS